jgi:hypothetical protein
MDAGATDVSRIIEYGRGKRTMDKLPWALLGVLVGLAMIVYVDTRFPAAWIMVLLALGFIAYALARHLFPARPMLTLSPAGISFHLAYLKDALIPWHEVQEVADFDLTGPHGPPNRYPEITAVLMSQNFYERHLLPKRRTTPKDFEGLLDVLVTSRLMMTSLGAGWDDVFRPKGALMQMALAHPNWFKIGPKDIREPVEARWKAFRERRGPATSVPSTNARTKAEPPRGGAQVYGASSLKLSPWQAVLCIVPLIGILAVVTNAMELWDTPGLRAAREDVAKESRSLEQARKESQRIRDDFKRSNEAAAERERQSRELEREMNRIFTK